MPLRQPGRGKGNDRVLLGHPLAGQELAIGGLQSKVLRASLLASGQPLQFEQTANRLVFKGPAGC